MTEPTFAELLDRKEPLDSELEPYLFEGKHWKMLKHPLLFSVPYVETNALHNYRFRLIKKQIEKARVVKDWWQILILHERPYRLQAFVDICHQMDDQHYWEILGWLWSDSENIWQNVKVWKNLLKSSRPGREFFMDEEERTKLATLPDKLIVYRGYQPGKNKHGLSYTLDRKRAEWFAKRFSKTGQVVERQICKKDVFAYLNGRNEDEVIVLKLSSVRNRIMGIGKPECGDTQSTGDTMATGL